MQDVAFELRSDGSEHFFIGRRQYSRAPGSTQWMRRHHNGEQDPASRHRVRYIRNLYRHRDELKQVRGRFPRLPVADIAKEMAGKSLAELVTEGVQLIDRGHPANVRLGHIFIHTKDRVGRGNWKAFFAKNFAPRGISLRTATDYMNMAREEAKRAESALFPSASDEEARAVKASTKKATESQADDSKTTKTRKKRPRLDGIYKLPLDMTGEMKDATDLFLKSKKWPKAEKKLRNFLRRMLLKYGFLRNQS